MSRKRAPRLAPEDPTPPTVPSILDLEAQAPLTREQVDAFLASHTVPVVEGRDCTFLYRGEADSVALRHGIYGLPSSQPFERIPGSDLWYRIVELPEGSRVEYKLEVTTNGLGRLIEDPLNPARSHDPFGSNSVAAAHGYVVPEWTRPDPEARRGSLEDLTFQSDALGGNRRVSLYLPARFRRSRRYPLLVVHDGGDFLDYAGMRTVLDNLIHRLEVADLVVALLHPKDRLVEYANHEGHARFVTEELVPWLEKSFPLEGTPRGRCLMGASFGAVASLSTAWRTPGFYGRLLLQSGSFAFSDIGRHARGPVFDPVAEFVNAFRRKPGRVSERLFVSCGVFESLIYENRSLVPLLQSTGMEVKYVEAKDGHNWENWRDRLRVGLSYLFPGPLWLVYE